MRPAESPRVALLYPGDRAMRDRADPAESRFSALFQALAGAGIAAEPAVYHDDFADEVQAQLRQARLVLVWCNPIEGGRRRDRLDTLLRRLAEAGVTVSAHPETILKLGTKDVLLQTRNLPFGSDVQRIDSLSQLRAELPLRLRSGARVLKQHRGHSGIGVWRVELASQAEAEAGAMALNVQHAQRGCEPELLSLDLLLARLAPYFEPANGGHLVDQAWQPRLSEGMVRAYLVGDRVAGFGHQAVNALCQAVPGQAPPQPGPRLYHGPDLVGFQGLRRQLESGWIAQLCSAVGLSQAQLPLLWDCDFMLGQTSAAEPERHVLCEINVSSVSPFPPSAIGPLVEAVQACLRGGHQRP